MEVINDGEVVEQVEQEFGDDIELEAQDGNIPSDSELDMNGLSEVNDAIVTNTQVNAWKNTILDWVTWLSAVTQTVSTVLIHGTGRLLPSFMLSWIAPPNVKMVKDDGEHSMYNIIDAFVVLDAREYFSQNSIAAAILQPDAYKTNGNFIDGIMRVPITNQIRWYFKKSDIIPVELLQSYLKTLLPRKNIIAGDYTTEIHIVYKIIGRNNCHTIVLDTVTENYKIISGENIIQGEFLFGMFNLPDLQD